ncbi:MAG: nucleotide exchange factor GrpE, partial [Sideroxydans sp.]
MKQQENQQQIEQQEAIDANETPAAQTADKIPSMEEMLQEAERRAQEHYDAWMYAKAEGENIRRRAAEDI